MFYDQAELLTGSPNKCKQILRVTIHDQQMTQSKSILHYANHI